MRKLAHSLLVGLIIATQVISPAVASLGPSGLILPLDDATSTPFISTLYDGSNDGTNGVLWASCPVGQRATSLAAFKSIVVQLDSNADQAGIIMEVTLNAAAAYAGGSGNAVEWLPDTQGQAPDGTAMPFSTTYSLGGRLLVWPKWGVCMRLRVNSDSAGTIHAPTGFVTRSTKEVTSYTQNYPSQTGTRNDQPSLPMSSTTVVPAASPGQLRTAWRIRNTSATVVYCDVSGVAAADGHGYELDPGGVLEFSMPNEVPSQAACKSAAGSATNATLMVSYSS